MSDAPEPMVPARVDIIGGDGVVVRHGGVVAWANGPDAAALVDALTGAIASIDHGDGTSDSGGDGDGAQGARLSVAAAGAGATGFAAVVVLGGGWLALATGSGVVRASDESVGDDPGGRLVAAGGTVTLGDVTVVQTTTAQETPFDLGRGAMPGAGAHVLSASSPREAGADAPVAAVPGDREFDPAVSGDPFAASGPVAPAVVGPLPALAPRSGPPPAPVLAGEPPQDPSAEVEVVPVEPPSDRVIVDLRVPPDPPLAPRPPLPRSLPSEPTGGVQVTGVRCGRGHFNNPLALYCRVCGLSMLQQTASPYRDERPPLGVLVCDDGATYALDRDVLVGADPSVVEEVRNGAALGLAFAGDVRSLEPVHAAVDLDAWEVVVSNRSRAGTTAVFLRGATQWVVPAPGEGVRLTPGAQVAVGDRRFVFESNVRA